ncbi:alpha/beta fold hydrolase [Paenibacillus sp.]|uniref:alpha/beta hydrolase n=1 Tax=Paenibacillus sp. TaxID=58172 RepID=UPI00281202B1|nr:alpha/beta fold hydrolase [Paenibacillus sp.]
MERHIEIRSQGARLAATLHYPPMEGAWEPSRFPAVVICHGFAGDRIGEHRLFVKAARAFASAGYAALRFDYAGCGESGGDYGDTGMDDWIAQTRCALDYVLDLDFVDPNRVALLGHSLGGAVAALTAARDKRAKTLALWAPTGHPFQDIVGIVGKAAYEEAVTQGETEYLGYALKPAFFASLATCHPFREARTFEGDALLVHGTADAVIPVEYSFLYQKVFRTRSGGQCEKEIIMQGDHVFSGRGHAERAIRTTLDWLRQLDKQKTEWFGWMI